MRTPRRYRLAMMAYPRAYREARAPEFAATLAEGDEERGGPSLRESAALVVRGAAMRAKLLDEPEWMLIAAAVLPLIALFGGFTWIERIFILDGGAAAILTTDPGWWSFAMGIMAFVVLAVLLFGAAVSRRRRLISALLAAPLALLLLTPPSILFDAGVPSPATVVGYIAWGAEASFHDWTRTLPAAAGAVLGTWLALELLASLSSGTRRRAMSAALAGLGVVAVAKSLARPDLQTEYAQSAFADLGAAVLLAAVSVALALGALPTRRTKPQL